MDRSIPWWVKLERFAGERTEDRVKEEDGEIVRLPYEFFETQNVDEGNFHGSSSVGKVDFGNFTHNPRGRKIKKDFT